MDTAVVSDDEIRISGRTANPAKAATLDGLPSAAAVVPSFARKWRPTFPGSHSFTFELELEVTSALSLSSGEANAISSVSIAVGGDTSMLAGC